MSYPSGDLRDQLAHVGAEAVRSGLVVGSGGNLSARHPGADACWVTAADTWLDRLERPEFSLLRISDGAVLDGHPSPSSEWRLHTYTYRARPDANALVHLHPQASVLLAALGHKITLVTTDQSFYVREVVVRPYVQPGTDGLAQDAADAVSGGANAVVLGHHGCSVLGESIELAHKRAFNLEEAAHTTALAIMLGTAADAIPACPPGYVEAMLRGGATS